MINQFFNLAQIESGDIKYDIKKYNITSLCREIVLGYYDLLYTKGMMLKLIFLNTRSLSELIRKLLLELLKILLIMQLNMETMESI